jgi:hypothetical protein
MATTTARQTKVEALVESLSVEERRHLVTLLATAEERAAGGAAFGGEVQGHLMPSDPRCFERHNGTGYGGDGSTLTFDNVSTVVGWVITVLG